MRKNFLICAVLAAAMILSPLTVMNAATRGQGIQSDDKKAVVSVLLSENGEVERVDEKEYVVGALAAEADMSHHEEALKAQAVACYTYMKYRKLHSGIDGADVSDDSSTCQGYIDRQARKDKWQDRFDEYEKKAERVADSVLGTTMMYDGEPILAVYHELNSGKTQSAKTVWGKDYPYLTEVESAGDRLSPDYSKTVVISESDFKARALKIKGVGLVGNDIKKWITDIDTTDSGYVKSLTLGGFNLKGSRFREAFGLNSCSFTIDIKDKSISIKTLGKGHEVGMSQYGANYMAQNGSNYEEILNHYFQNVEII